MIEQAIYGKYIVQMYMHPIIDHFQTHGIRADQTKTGKKQITNYIWGFQYLLLSNWYYN